MKSIFDLFPLWVVLSLAVDLLQATENAMEEGVEFLRRYSADTVNCQNVSEIMFLGYFPCLRHGSSFNASESIRECDLLAEAAAYLAVDRVNRDPNILPNVTLKLYPIYVPRQRESQVDGSFYDVLEQTFNLLDSNYSKDIWGIVGPDDDPRVANFIAPISEKSGLITVSYGATSIEDNTETVSTFYRTLPSDRVENYGRLVLLVKHEWFRIGILTSVKDTHYLKQSSHFISIFNHYIEKSRLELDVVGTFEDSPTPALRMIKSRDINIIIGFFGPDNARRVMCQAKTEGLVSPDHAWVLPSYYDPNWWKSPSNVDCSHEEMRYILESVIFVDTSKFPPVGRTLDEFYSELLTKAKELYPSLTEDDLKPYLLRSRATSAYDAVTLLALSVGEAFDHGGDSCTNTNMIQVALDQAFLACEYCRIYSLFPQCFNLSSSFEHCKECYNLSDPNFRFTPELYSYLRHQRNNTKPRYLLDDYGQILYSQYQGGEECPIVLYWPGLGDEDYKNGYIPISSLDDETMCVSQRLTLSQRNFVSEDSNCSKTFKWRGSPYPPSSRLIEVFYIPAEGLIAIGVSVLIGLGVAFLLINFNIFWRTNRIVKATSPWINIVLLGAVIIRLPSTLLYGLSVSVGHYPGLRMVRDWTPLCHLNLWMYYIGDGLFMATLIAKNWRIYRIFYNKKLEERGDKLSNNMLMVGIALPIFPVVIILVVWSAIGVEFFMYSIQNENLQFVKFTTCFRSNGFIFDLVTNFYIFVLVIFLFILSLLTASVPTSNFRREGVVTYKAVVIILLPIPMVFLSRIIFLVAGKVEQLEILLWVEFSWTTVLPLILLAILFGPTIRAVFRHYVDEIQATSEEKEDQKLSLKYIDLRSKADELRVHLEELDNGILRVKAGLKASSQSTTDSLKSFSIDKTKSCPNINMPDTTDFSNVPDTLELTVALSSGNEINLTPISPNHIMTTNSLLVADGNNKANSSDDGMQSGVNIRCIAVGTAASLTGNTADAPTLPHSNDGTGQTLSTFSKQSSTYMKSDYLQDEESG